MKNTQNGISLIALVVTVLVLIILTIMTISNMQKHGIIEHSNKIAMEWNEAEKGDGNNYFIIDGDDKIGGDGWEDDIPPSIPQIIVKGTKERENFYVSTITVEIIPGIDDDSEDIGETQYTINGEKSSISNNSTAVETIANHGTYTIEATTFDEANNKSATATLEVTVHLTHTWDSGTTVQIAKCVNGTKTYKCTVCNTGAKTETIRATLSHTNTGSYYGGDWDATCTKAAGYLVYCGRGCGTLVSVNSGSALGHNYQPISTVSSEYWCSYYNNYYHQIRYKCDRCGGYVYKNESHYKDLNFKEWLGTVIAGKDYWKYKCSICREWFTVEEDNPYWS